MLVFGGLRVIDNGLKTFDVVVPFLLGIEIVFLSIFRYRVGDDEANPKLEFGRGICRPRLRVWLGLG